MVKMHALIIGGFSTLSKRALVERAMSSTFARAPDAKITVLLNGEEDFVTDGFDRDHDVQVELFGEGCFCCTLRDSLSLSLKIQKEVRRPDLMIMLASVITDIGVVGMLIDQIIGAEMEVTKYFTMDLENAIALMDTFHEMIARNVRSSDTVFLIGDINTSFESKQKVIDRLKDMAPNLEETISYNVKDRFIMSLESRT